MGIDTGSEGGASHELEPAQSLGAAYVRDPDGLGFDQPHEEIRRGAVVERRAEFILEERARFAAMEGLHREVEEPGSAGWRRAEEEAQPGDEAARGRQDRPLGLELRAAVSQD